MQKKLSLLLLIFISLFLYRCASDEEKKVEKVSEPVIARTDTFQILCQYWQMTDADHPAGKDVAFKTATGIPYQPGIVFMTDSTMLENPAGEMTYGKFKLKGNTINVEFDNGQKAVYQIITLNSKEMILKRTEQKLTSELFYKATDTYWENAEKDPFAKKNYQWVQKPAKSETDDGIKKRAKDCVQFYAYYFHGFAAGGATKINFEALPCCFNWYEGGIFIQNEKKLDKKWINCFYSRDEALKARQLLEEALNKKYDWDTTQSNWVKQTALVLQQIHDGM